MHLVDGSVTVVLVGDWNKFYIKPDWVAGNISQIASASWTPAR